MALTHPQSQQYHNQVEVIRAFQPTGSQTVVWAQNMNTRRGLYLLRWGQDIYLPVTDQMRVGLAVYNGRDTIMGYPAYAEALNVYAGGPADPALVMASHMWEVRPGETTVIDAIVDPHGDQGLPFVITRAGFGQTIGEASFGTNEFRGQFRIYEKLPLGGGYQIPRDTNQGVSRGTTRGGGTMRSFNADDGSRGIGSGPTRGMSKGVPESYGAGIGAGAEERRAHVATYIKYGSAYQPVVFYRFEYRNDLAAALDFSTRWLPNYQWEFDIPSWDPQWWADSAWTWPWAPHTTGNANTRPGGLMPHIPRTRG